MTQRPSARLKAEGGEHHAPRCDGVGTILLIGLTASTGQFAQATVQSPACEEVIAEIARAEKRAVLMGTVAAPGDPRNISLQESTVQILYQRMTAMGSEEAARACLAAAPASETTSALLDLVALPDAEGLRCRDLAGMVGLKRTVMEGQVRRVAVAAFEHEVGSGARINAVELNSHFAALCSANPDEGAVAAMLAAQREAVLPTTPGDALEGVGLAFAAWTLLGGIEVMANTLANGPGQVAGDAWDGTYKVLYEYDGVNPFVRERKLRIRCGGMLAAEFTATHEVDRGDYYRYAGNRYPTSAEVSLAECSAMAGRAGNR